MSTSSVTYWFISAFLAHATDSAPKHPVPFAGGVCSPEMRTSDTPSGPVTRTVPASTISVTRYFPDAAEPVVDGGDVVLHGEIDDWRAPSPPGEHAGTAPSTNGIPKAANTIPARFGHFARAAVRTSMKRHSPRVLVVLRGDAAECATVITLVASPRRIRIPVDDRYSPNAARIRQRTLSAASTGRWSEACVTGTSASRTRNPPEVVTKSIFAVGASAG